MPRSLLARVFFHCLRIILIRAFFATAQFLSTCCFSASRSLFHFFFCSGISRTSTTPDLFRSDVVFFTLPFSHFRAPFYLTGSLLFVKDTSPHLCWDFPYSTFGLPPFMANPNNPSMEAPVRYLCGAPVYGSVAPLQVADHPPMGTNLAQPLPIAHGEERVQPISLHAFPSACFPSLQPTHFPPSFPSHFGPNVIGLSPSTFTPISSSMDKGPKLPMPKAIDEDFLRNNSDDALMVKNRLELIADYIAPGVSLSMFTWKEGFRPFMLAPLAMGF